MKKLRTLKNTCLSFVTSLYINIISPIQSFALTHAEIASGDVIKLAVKILNVITSAGIILLAYSVVAFALAMKDENSESKVNATTQIAVAIVMITFSASLAGLAALFNLDLNAANVTNTTT